MMTREKPRSTTTMRTYREGQKRHPSSPRRALGALRTLDFFSSSPPAQQQRYIPLLQDEAQSTKYAARPTDAPLPGFLASHHQRMMTQQRHQDARSPLPLRRAKPPLCNGRRDREKQWPAHHSFLYLWAPTSGAASPPPSANPSPPPKDERGTDSSRLQAHYSPSDESLQQKQ